LPHIGSVAIAVLLTISAVACGLGKAVDALVGRDWSHDGVFLYLSVKSQPTEISLAF
jgi:hypothetical protein